MTKRTPRYMSYLLRLWEAGDGKERAWRASLESPGTGERQGFASLENLFTFLHTQMEHQDEQGTRYRSNESISNKGLLKGDAR